MISSPCVAPVVSEPGWVTPHGIRIRGSSAACKVAQTYQPHGSPVEPGAGGRYRVSSRWLAKWGIRGTGTHSSETISDRSQPSAPDISSTIPNPPATIQCDSVDRSASGALLDHVADSTASSNRATTPPLTSQTVEPDRPLPQPPHRDEPFAWFARSDIPSELADSEGRGDVLVLPLECSTVAEAPPPAHAAKCHWTSVGGPRDYSVHLVHALLTIREQRRSTVRAVSAQ